MASAGGDNGGSVPHNFFLTPHQQSLLFAALNANKQTDAASPESAGLSLSPSSFKPSPIQPIGSAGFHDSTYLDNYDYDFGESSFDFSTSGVDQSQTIGDEQGAIKSESPENDANDKRNHPDDDEGEDRPGNDSKRHEGIDKGPKKPGRKPLTSEPTTKRKAQNRAAQRAFRERKEKHLKDLETKVQELEAASEAANHENSKLCTQLETMTGDLNRYKQRLAVLTNANKAAPRDMMGYASTTVNNLSDVNFQFDMPNFGALSAVSAETPSSSLSPLGQMMSSPAMTQASDNRPSQSGRLQENQKKYTGAPAPSVGSYRGPSSRASVDSGNVSVNGASSSPSASSNSNGGNGGAASSCGTSPEPSTHSPIGYKPLETLTTIGEEQQQAVAPGQQPFAQFASVDIGSPSFNWLAGQNGGHFDPQLFDDYRESQDSVLSNPMFDDLFNDGLDSDFLNPYNVPSEAASAPTPKKNLIDEIDAKQKSLDDTQQNMRCTAIWEKLQSCQKAQSGEFDLDGLCSELTKKAKCSGSGPVVAERDFDTILKKYMGKDAAASPSSLGVKVHPDEEANWITSS